MPGRSQACIACQVIANAPRIVAMAGCMLWLFPDDALAADPCPPLDEPMHVPEGSPDLTVNFHDFTHHPPVSGVPTEAWASVTVGQAPIAVPFDLVLCVDGFVKKTMTWQPKPVEPELAAGTSMTFPSKLDLAPGPHTLRWVVDSAHKIDELDELNNAADIYQYWRELSQAPDLYVKSISTQVLSAQGHLDLTGDYLYGEKSTLVRVQIANAGGDYTTDDFTVRITHPFEAQAKYFTVPMLAPGKTVTFSFEMPASTIDSATFTAKADIYNDVAEGDESNNTKDRTFVTRSGDLAVDSVTIDNRFPGKDDPGLGATITNVGDGPVPYTTVARV